LQYAGAPTVRAEIGHALQKLGKEGISVFGFADIVNRLPPNLTINPETAKTVLGTMLREGVIERLHKLADGTTAFSSITLRAPQLAIAQRLQTILEGIQNNDTSIIQECIARGKEIIHTPELVTQLLRRGYQHSSSVNTASYEQRAAEIAELVTDEPQTTAEIAGLYSTSGLTNDGVYTVLARMRRGGLVTSRRVGNQVYWSRR
jgi:hypothetical protein